MVPLRYKLHNGDIVEILTQPGHKPSRDWLALRQVLARAEQDQALAQRPSARAGHRDRPKLIEKEARKYRIALKEISRTKTARRSRRTMDCGKADDLMAGIGYGKYSARQVLAKLAAGRRDVIEQPATQSEGCSQPGGIASVVRRVFGGCTTAHQGARTRRPAGLPRAMLQSDPRRRASSATSRAAKAWRCTR